MCALVAVRGNSTGCAQQRGEVNQAEHVDAVVVNGNESIPFQFLQKLVKRPEHGGQGSLREFDTRWATEDNQRRAMSGCEASIASKALRSRHKQVLSSSARAV